MQINEGNIKEAEKILINEKEFGPERLDFIRNLKSCDLLAVPGSGKTTVLQAKLYCLAKLLPFDDGSGILVLSHTNAAVEEIEKNLRKYCPILFQYPNFVGTVQSFVNKYLANPACFAKYGTYINIVDDDIANKIIEDQTKNLPYDDSLSKYFFIQTYNQYADVTKKRLEEEYNIRNNQLKEIIKFLKNQKIMKNGHLIYDKVKNLQQDAIKDPTIRDTINDIHSKAKKLTGIEKNKRGIRYYLNFTNNRFEDKKPFKFDSDSGKSLFRIFENNFSKGITRYKDCYSLAFWYLSNYQEIKQILQKRFKFVFIDEMQDLEKYQIDVIDRIFYDEQSPTILQRIGDVNQSIYNLGKTVNVQPDWRDIRNPMYLNGSYRLTLENANLVNSFTFDRQKDENGNPRFIVEGKRINDTLIKPYMILFDNQTTGQLEIKFRELIRYFSLQDKDEGKKYGFKIIGWSAVWDDNEVHEGKLRLENIFPTFKKGKKETFDSLCQYLQLFDHNKNTLMETRKAVLNSLIHILRIENKTYSTKIRGKETIRYYTICEMIKYIQDETNDCDYELFKDKVFKWSYYLSTCFDYERVYKAMCQFIKNDFTLWFNLSLSDETNKFIGNSFESIINNKLQNIKENNQNQIKIEIDTVHSAKGQTHCATMYVETSYKKYETQKARIKEALKKEEHGFSITDEKNKTGIEALKMMYVGFSRPTHLLCFACLKDNLSDSENYNEYGWEIIDLTI